MLRPLMLFGGSAVAEIIPATYHHSDETPGTQINGLQVLNGELIPIFARRLSSTTPPSAGTSYTTPTDGTLGANNYAVRVSWIRASGDDTTYESPVFANAGRCLGASFAGAGDPTTALGASGNGTSINHVQHASLPPGSLVFGWTRHGTVTPRAPAGLTPLLTSASDTLWLSGPVSSWTPAATTGLSTADWMEMTIIIPPAAS